VGIVADEPGNEMELKAFHAKVVKGSGGAVANGQLPVVRKVDAATIQENFRRIKREVEALVDSEMKRITGDPGLKAKVVKK
jgi:hypothetical protein